MPISQRELLASIDPAVAIEPYARRADEALNSFRPCPSRVGSWSEFKCLLVRFLFHTEVAILKLSHPCSVDPEFDWDRATDILVRAYGPNGPQAAMEIARTGNEQGGVYGVLRAFAQAMADEVAEHRIAVYVTTYWNSLSVPEQHAACDEYLRNYGHLLPSEVTESHATRVRMNFPTKVLAEHPRLVQRLRGIGRGG